MLSVLIVNWNTRALLSACLESLRRFPPTCPMEVIVVDNASGDGSAEMVRDAFPEVRLIASDRNLGYAAGNNAAFAAASGDWLLTLNPDTEVFESTLDTACETLARSPKVGVLGARQIGTDGKTQRSIRGFPTLIGFLGASAGLDRLFPNSPLGAYRLPNFDYEREQLAPQPMGTFLLFRREALVAVGDATHPFDEQFPIFFNEVDLLFRLKQAGWGCLYAPGVQIRHHGGESTKQVRKNMIWESHRSLVRYLRKHRPGLLLPIWSLLIYASAFIRARGVYAGFRS